MVLGLNAPPLRILTPIVESLDATSSINSSDSTAQGPAIIAIRVLSPMRIPLTSMMVGSFLVSVLTNIFGGVNMVLCTWCRDCHVWGRFVHDFFIYFM